MVAAALVALTVVAPNAGATDYSWLSAVDGAASDPLKWSPNGIPGSPDHVFFDVLGSYAVTLNSGTPLINRHSYRNGAVTLHVTSAHTTTGFEVGLNSGASVTIDQGSVNVGYLALGQAGPYCTMTLTGGTTVFSSGSSANAFGNGDQIGYTGNSQIDVVGGAQYFSSTTGGSRLTLGTLAGASTTLHIAGLSGAPPTYSGVHTTSGASMVVGESGVANLIANNGGYVDVTGFMLIGRLGGSQGYVTSGPVATLGTSSIHVHGDLGIGNSGDGASAGHGELTVRDRSWVDVDGQTLVGDPNGDTGAVLRVLTGGTFITSNGLTMNPTGGLGLDLQGGITHVHGGSFTWPANRVLTVSSTVGSPELWISTGAFGTGPSTPLGTPQLYIGRSGQGTLRITRNPLLITMGDGATVLGDSLGGSGTMVCDSAVWVANTGPITVGKRGTGTLRVLGGSRVFGSVVEIGAVASASGNVQVIAPGSEFNTEGAIYVGGSAGGPGGTGTLTIDGGVVTVTEIPTPAPATVYVEAGTGTLSLSHSALLVSTQVQDAGITTVSGSEIDAPTTTVTSTGVLQGNGVLTGSLSNAGKVAPAGTTGPFGAITMQSGFQQTATGHYRVVLGSTGGRRCDSLVVSGAATLAGALDLIPDPSFVHTAGDTFTILTCGSRTGTFTTVTWNGSTFTGHVQVLYQPGAVRLIMIGTTGVDPRATSGAVRFAAVGGPSSLAFRLDLPDAADVQVTLYDVSGREVAEVYRGRLTAGAHRLAPVDAERVPSGAYFARAVIRTGAARIERSARAVLRH